MKDKLILKGHVLYAEKTMYKWVADFGENTCKTCAAMDGKMFEKDKVPYWPHPNCRCRVEEVSVIDVLESEMHDYKEELEQLSLQANELLGDSHVLEERINKLEKEFDDEEVKKLSNDLNHQQCEIFRLIDYIDALNIDTVSATVVENIGKFIEEIRINLKKLLDRYKDYDKILIVQVVEQLEKIGPDAVELFRLSCNRLKDINGYIKKNGHIVNKISELNNPKLEKDVSKKVKDQLNTNDSRGLVLHKNSSLAKDIIKTHRFQSFIKDNIEKIIARKRYQDDNLTFWPIFNANPNVFGSIHKCSIVNIRVEGDYIKAEIIDTVDYNDGEVTVAIFRYLQQTGQLENFFFVVEIEVPISDFYQEKK